MRTQSMSPRQEIGQRKKIWRDLGSRFIERAQGNLGDCACAPTDEDAMLAALYRLNGG